MKRNIVLITLITIVAIFFIVTLVNSERKDTLTEVEDDTYGEFVGIKKTVIEGTDGWYYTFAINNFKKDNKIITTNFYNGYNLKYEKMEDCNMIVYDDATGEVLRRIPTFPTFASSEKTKNGVRERDEIKAINQYFDEKQFNKEITIDNLYDLKTENFSKKQILDLYNKTIKKEAFNGFSDFNLNAYEFKKIEINKNYTINMGILSERIGVIALRIDILYNNGKYLSDLVEKKKASLEQIEIYNNFKKIEKQFVDTQNINIREEFDLNDKIYDEIFKVIESFDKEVEYEEYN